MSKNSQKLVLVQTVEHEPLLVRLRRRLCAAQTLCEHTPHTGSELE